MAIIRHEKQEYGTAALVVAETLAPQANDAIYVEALTRTFDWIQGSAAVADNNYVIDQTSATASGRWIATSSAKATYTGTVNTDAMANGQTSVINATIAGVLTTDKNVVMVTNAGTFPTDVIVTSTEVTAANTVKVVVENQSGAATAAFAVNLTVLVF